MASGQASQRLARCPSATGYPLWGPSVEEGLSLIVAVLRDQLRLGEGKGEMMLVEVTVNPDGTFRVETTSPHYNAASFGEAVGWFAEQLLYEQERAKAESKTVELALRHVDATIAALGLGEQGGSEMTKDEAAVMITGFWEVVWATRDTLEAEQEAEQAENSVDGGEAQ